MTKALVAIKTRFENELPTFKIISKLLSDEFDILKISSVYQLGSGSEFALGNVIEITGFVDAPAELHRKILKILSSVKEKTFSAEILTIEDMVFRSPQITIPHPQLHQSPSFLMPASEICPEYVHPVLNEELGSLLNRLDTSEISFFAQSKTLLDFLAIEKY